MFHEGFLQRMQLHLFMDALGKPFDGDDRLSIGALGGIDAGDHRLAIHQDGTGAAFGFFTADLCACKAKPLAEESGKGFTGDRLESDA